MKKKEIIKELIDANHALKLSFIWGIVPVEYSENFAPETRKYAGLKSEYVAREMSELIDKFKHKI